MSGQAQLDSQHNLTAQQEAFIKEFHLTNHVTNSAIASGCPEKGAAAQGSKWLKMPKILARLDQLRKETEETFGIKKQDIIDELKIIAFGSIGDILDWTADEVTIKPKDKLTPQQIKYIEAIQFEKRMEPTGEQDKETGKDLYAPTYKIKFTTLAKEKREALKMLGQLQGLWKPEKAAAAGSVGDIFNTQNNLIFVAEWGTGAPIKKVKE